MSSDLPPPLGIFLKGLLVFLSHSLKFFSVRGHIQIVLVLADVGLAQIIESSDISTVQTHVPLQGGTSQTILEVVDKELMIIGLCRHLPCIHCQMTPGASVPFVFFKIWDFKLVWYLDIWLQAKIISIFPEQFFPTESFDFPTLLVDHPSDHKPPHSLNGRWVHCLAGWYGPTEMRKS